MKFIVIFLCLLFSTLAYAAKPDLTEQEVIAMLRKEFPQDKGDIIIKYLPANDQWSFLFHVKGSHPIPGLDRNGTVDDDRKNPKIFQFMEG